VLRDDFTPQSDIDVLVEFEPTAPIGVFEMVDLRDELETLFQRQVDLGTPAGLSKYIREKVLESAQVIYERP
jgi:predicted nucleotidyltransferase